MPAPAGPAFGPIDTHEGHQARSEKRGSRSFQIIFYPRRRNASLIFGWLGHSKYFLNVLNAQRTTDDTTPTTTRKKSSSSHATARVGRLFCIAQRRRTEFLCSEKEGTARGTRGRFFRCVGLTVTSQKATTKEHTTHTKERTPVVHLTLAYLTHSDRVTEVARGANARPGRSPKTNRDRRRRLRKHRRSSRVAAIVNDASFLFCGRTGFGGFEFSLFKR